MSTYDKYANEVKQAFPGLAKKANKAMGSAIRLFCLECMGGTKAAIKQVNECETTSCPLHKFRSGKRSQTEAQKRAAIKNAQSAREHIVRPLGP